MKSRTEQIKEAAYDAKAKHIGYWGSVAYAFIDGAEWADAHPHWISVEDELPKKETEVLMVSSGFDGILYGYRCKNGKYGWYCYDDDNYWHNITHWMPLPALPEHIADVGKMISSSELPNNCKKGGER